MLFRDDPARFVLICGLCGAIVALNGAYPYGPTFALAAAFVGFFLGMMMTPALAWIFAQREFIASLTIPLMTGIIVGLAAARTFHPRLTLTATIGSVLVSCVAIRLATSESPVRRSRGVCHCGYPIIATTVERCSECGRLIVEDASILNRRNRILPQFSSVAPLFIIPLVVLPLSFVLWKCNTVTVPQLREMIDSGEINGKTVDQLDEMFGWLRDKRRPGLYMLSPWVEPLTFFEYTTDGAGRVTSARLTTS